MMRASHPPAPVTLAIGFVALAGVAAETAVILPAW
jgi:Cu/Ag efflux pump CusA